MRRPLSWLCLLAVAHGAHAGDWRDDLPKAAQDAVKKVDDKAEKEKKQHEKDLDDDFRMGRDYAIQVEKEMKLSKNEFQLARLQRVGAEIAAIAQQTNVNVLWGDSRLNPFTYQFKLLEGKDGKEVNAFSLPGGFIYFYDGLMNYTESDDELAGVVAHEISHAAFRHVATLQREQSKLQLLTLPLILLSLFSGGNATAAGLGQVGSLLGQAVGSGWSVKAEQAADWGGFQYLQKSKFNPLGMLTFMERLAYDDRHGSRVDWGIFTTHPPSRERAAAMRAKLTEFGIPILRSKVTQSLRAVPKLEPDGSVSIRFANQTLVTMRGPNAMTRAENAAVRISAFTDSIPRMWDVSVQGNRVLGGSQVLYELAEGDAVDTSGAISAAAARLKSILFDLSYRVSDPG